MDRRSIGRWVCRHVGRNVRRYVGPRQAKMTNRTNERASERESGIYKMVSHKMPNDHRSRKGKRERGGGECACCLPWARSVGKKAESRHHVYVCSSMYVVFTKYSLYVCMYSYISGPHCIFPLCLKCHHCIQHALIIWRGAFHCESPLGQQCQFIPRFTCKLTSNSWQTTATLTTAADAPNLRYLEIERLLDGYS